MTHQSFHCGVLNSRRSDLCLCIARWPFSSWKSCTCRAWSWGEQVRSYMFADPNSHGFTNNNGNNDRGLTGMKPETLLVLVHRHARHGMWALGLVDAIMAWLAPFSLLTLDFGDRLLILIFFRRYIPFFRLWGFVIPYPTPCDCVQSLLSAGYMPTLASFFLIDVTFLPETMCVH